MFKETIENNAEVKANTKELEALKKHFPSCFDKEGKFDIKIFEELVKTEEVDIKKEGYSLNFLGKSYARYLSSLDSETVIVPDENNNDIDSENIYIVGDNLDALQHLKYSYSEKIKCIYIDPPYNTGSDGFVYNDKFEFTAEELAKKINIEDDEAERILNMQGKSTHSAWLTFMYPRLELAKELLSDDGVIFISIDDNEQANLKKLCDEIFGEFNFLGTFVINSTPNARDYGHIGKMHEFVLFYAKNAVATKTNMLPEKNKTFKYNDAKGGYNIHPLYNSNEAFTNLNRPNLYYPFYIYPSEEAGEGLYKIGIEPKEGSVKIYPPKSVKNNVQFVWRWGKEKALANINEEIIGYKTGDEYRIVQKMRHSEKIIRSLLIDTKYSSRKGTAEVEQIFGAKCFSFPKPIALIYNLIKIATNKNDIILDFFSGSATTAHAVMHLNAEDNGNRKYIMVQLPEETDEKSEAYRAGYKTIDEIGRERIRRAAAKIKKEEPEKSKNVDLEFKTYYLQDIDSNTLDKIREFNPDMPIDAKDIQDKFGKDAIIETWKIRDGFGFNASLEEINLSGYTAYKVSDSKVGVYLYLLDDMESEAIQELVRQLEAFELNVDKIIEYGYSFSYNANTALRANLKTLKNKNAIDVLIRY